MDADLKTAGHQCTDTPFNRNQNVKCKCTKAFFFIFLFFFHKSPGSLPAQLSWPLLWAACPYRLQPRERPYCLFQTLYLHDNPPEQTLQRTKSPRNIQTSSGVRYTATHGTRRSWNCCFEISCKLWQMESTIILSTLLLHSKIDSSNSAGWK